MTNKRIEHRNMMRTFENKQFGSIRVLEKDSEPWFVGKDVAEVLGYERPTKAISDHVDEQDKDEVPIQDSIGRMQNTPIINESGLYSLIFSSKLPAAKEFKHWVTSEVLPSIRKHGMYAVDALLDNPDFAIQTFQRLKEERDKRLALEQQAELDKPKVLFADAVSASDTSILIGELAKILKQNGIETGQQRLFEWLRENGYLMKTGSSRNMPTQRSMELGLFEVVERTIAEPNGSIRVTKTPKVSGVGQQYFINLFLSETEAV